MEEVPLTPEEKLECFNAFIEEYKEKSLLDKQKLVIDDLKELVALIQKLCLDYKIDVNLLINREIADINKEKYTEDDFAEAVYVYIQMFKEVLSSFLVPMIEDDVEVD